MEKITKEKVDSLFKDWELNEEFQRFGQYFLNTLDLVCPHEEGGCLFNTVDPELCRVIIDHHFVKQECVCCK